MFTISIKTKRHQYKQTKFIPNKLITYSLLLLFFFNATAEANLFDLFGSGSLDLSEISGGQRSKLLGEMKFTLEEQ